MRNSFLKIVNFSLIFKTSLAFRAGTLHPPSPYAATPLWRPPPLVDIDSIPRKNPTGYNVFD